MASADENTPNEKAQQAENPNEEIDTSQAAPLQSTQKKEKEATNGQPVADKPDEKKQDEKKPAGGYDGTPLPKAPPGYTIKITFHRATSLPMADVNSLSSDPYIVAQIYTDLSSRHKEDPPLRKRTPTIRRSTDPVWDCDWIVANVPASGFRLKARIYDEDPATHDDRLGNAHVDVPKLSDDWPGLNNVPYKVKKRSGSKRAYFVRLAATCIGAAKHLNGSLYVTIKLLGRTEDEQGGGRIYTIGPNWFTRHYSPLLGRITGKKNDDNSDDAPSTPGQESKPKTKAQQYNFQANQVQMTGPVPWQLYHRFVEFKPWVRLMFTTKGFRGFLLYKALQHQHARVYAYDRNTLYGVLPSHGEEMTKRFLDLVHYDKGGRIFTYVLTLDSLWRFTETGKEFGIDMLSKHTMHSDVSIYIAFSGEFFIRRVKHKNASSRDIEEGNEPTHPPDDVAGGPPEEDAPTDPRNYELVIDNDSGTYRPNAKLLPLLREYLEENLPGLKVMTLDCQADADKMQKLKSEQRERKKKEGDGLVYTQFSRSGSISSSDEEDLNALANEQGQEDDILRSIKNDQTAKQKARAQKLKNIAKGRDHGGGRVQEDNNESQPVRAASADAEREPQENEGSAEPSASAPPA